MSSLTRSNVSAIVEYNYTAKEPDELDLIKGTIIHHIKVQSGGWWEGTLANGKTGMFPDNFVRILDSEDKNSVTLRDKTPAIRGRCKVVYSYTQYNEDELSLAVGDIIDVLGEVEEGWWRGKLGDKIGVFPSNFVVPIETTSPNLVDKRSTTQIHKKTDSRHSSKEDLLLCSSPSQLDKNAPLLPPKPTRELCRVLFPYEPQNEDELELNIGEIITIINKDLPDRGWWKGELKGKIGVFPDNFVILLSAEVSPSSKDSIRSERQPQAISKVRKSTGLIATQSTINNRKDSFGSGDSLSDDTPPSSSQHKQQNVLDNNKMNDPKSMRRSLEMKPSEIRRSLETPDEKKTPPPVFMKKPILPMKKSTTSVGGNLLSGLKQKIKGSTSSSNSNSSNYS